MMHREVKEDSDMGKQSKCLRQSFRNQIRRKQIQEIFAMKRKLAISVIDQGEKKHFKLGQLFSQVKSFKNLESSLTKLGNELYINQSIIRYQQQYGQKTTNNLCIQIVSTLLNQVLPSLNERASDDIQTRAKCLTIINNIMADAYAPHCQLIPIISQGLNNIYTNLSQANIQQTTQIGWIITNILCHKLDLSIQSQLQKPIEQILTIAQEILLFQDLQIMSILFRSFKKFYMYVDEFFGPNMQQKAQIQHFKIHRLILLQNAVNFNLNLEYGSTVLSVIQFVKQNLLYVDSCHQKIREDICSKCFQILQCSSSDKIMIAALGLIKSIAIKRDIIILIIKDHFDTIQKCILYFGSKIKIETLRLLIYLCADQELTTFIVKNKDLQQSICQLIKNVRDNQTLAQLVLLTNTILNQTNGNCGKTILGVIDQYLSHKAGTVGQLAKEVLKNMGSKDNYF